MTVTFIGFRGIGGILFSRGLDAIADMLSDRGWHCAVFAHTAVNAAVAFAARQQGPIVVMWHSAGATAGRLFAEQLGRSIDVGISVDAWMPNMQADPHYRRVVSVVAATAGRFHVAGPNVVRRVEIAGTTHTTVDDAAQLVAVLEDEIALLPKGSPVPDKPAALPRRPEREAFNQAFFAALRSAWGGLTQSQVDNCNVLLDAFEAHGDGRDKSLAYILATVRHEVGPRMAPVREGFEPTDAGARQAATGRPYGREINGQVYYGRGYVQLTWRENYAASSADAGVDLVRNPDAMLNPEIAAKITVLGILDGRWNKERKGIAHYLPADGPDDLLGARKTVNLTDRWQTIAGYYEQFLPAVQAGRAAQEALSPAPTPPRPDLPSPAPSLPEAAGPVSTWLERNFPALDDRDRQLLIAAMVILRGQPTAARPIVELAATTETRTMQPTGKAALASTGIIGGLLAAIGTIGQVVTGIGGPDAGQIVTQAQGDISQVVEHVSAIITAVGAIMAIIGRWRADKPITGIIKAQ